MISRHGSMKSSQKKTINDRFVVDIDTMSSDNKSLYCSPDLTLVINVRGNETWAQAGCITIDLGGHTHVWTWPDS